MVAEKVVLLFSYKHAIAFFRDFVAIGCNSITAHSQSYLSAINLFGAFCSAVTAEEAMVSELRVLGKIAQVHFILG